MALRNRATVGRVILGVALRFDVSPREIKGPSQLYELVAARRLVMTVCHKAGLNYSEIGRHLNRHHSTVMYGVTKMLAESRTDPELRGLIELLLTSSTDLSTGQTA